MSAQAEQLPTLEGGRRPDIEKELTDKYHVEWHYVPGAKVSQFDKEKSLHNQARFEPIDQDTVELYAEGVRRGDNFPAVLAFRPAPRARYVIIDGNHRLMAHDEAEAPIDLYEIDRDTDPQVLALMTFAFNTKHGRPTSEAERVSQAMYLVSNGASYEAAANAVSLPVRILKRAISRGKADQRAAETGVNLAEWDSLAAAAKGRLKDITTDEGFVAAAHLAFAAKLQSNEVFDLVGELNATRSGTKQRAIINNYTDAYRERIQAGAGGVLTTADRRKMSPRGRLGIILGTFHNIPNDDKILVESYAVTERPEKAKELREVSDRLARLADKLDPKKKGR